MHAPSVVSSACARLGFRVGGRAGLGSKLEHSGMAPSLEAEHPSRLEGDSGDLYGGCDGGNGREEALSPGFGG